MKGNFYIKDERGLRLLYSSHVTEDREPIGMVCKGVAFNWQIEGVSRDRSQEFEVELTFHNVGQEPTTGDYMFVAELPVALTLE